MVSTGAKEGVNIMYVYWSEC